MLREVSQIDQVRSNDPKTGTFDPFPQEGIFRVSECDKISERNSS